MKKITCKDNPNTGAIGPIITVSDTLRVRLEDNTVKTYGTLLVGDMIQTFPDLAIFEVLSIENI